MVGSRDQHRKPQPSPWIGTPQLQPDLRENFLLRLLQNTERIILLINVVGNYIIKLRTARKVKNI